MSVHERLAACSSLYWALLRRHGATIVGLFVSLAVIVICEYNAALAAEPFLGHVVTVADAIRMVRIDNPNYASGTIAKDDVAAFSPDGKQFVLLTHRGNLQTNTIDYRLLLVQTAEALHRPTPELLVSLASSSTRPAIDSIVWLDNQTLAFLGENPGEHHQLYRIDCVSKRLERLTNEPTNLVNYAFSANRATFFFTAQRPQESVFSSQSHIIVDGEELSDVISGKRPELMAGLKLFAMRAASDRPELVSVIGKLEGLSVPWPSPDGRYLAIQTIQTRSRIPSEWYDYQITAQQTHLSRRELSTINEYELVDLASGKSEPLVDAPVGAWYSNLAWSDDSRAIVISGINLPLDVQDQTERAARAANLFVAEVQIPERRIVPITHQDAIVRHWDSRAGKILLQATNHKSFSNLEEGPILAFVKTGGVWNQQSSAAPAAEPENPITIRSEEDMNTPPRVRATDLTTGKTAILLDPNPQFGALKFGRVEEIRFAGVGESQMKVGIYLPTDFRKGVRYPLVIQTHGWTSDRFVIDGPDPNGMAAQPLASKGFVIAQIGDEFFSASNSCRTAMDEFEWVIDDLDKKGLIDPKRLGIVGFSATGPGVGYAVAHSKYRFGAAVLSDTEDAGYFTYLSSSSLPGSKEWFETTNGGIPFGSGLDAWIKEAPEFSIDRVKTAMLLEPNEPWAVLGLWEWFAGLRRLGRPVEMIYTPEAGHVATRPLDRIVSQDGAVDWFDFWLNGHEDPDPSKAPQYERWHKLRALQPGQHATAPAQ